MGNELNGNNFVGSLPRLMHVVLSLDVGGAEKLVYDMMRHRWFRDCRPTVCCLQTLGPLGEKLQREGFSVYLCERKKGIDLGVIRWLSKIISKERIEVLHAHQYTPLFYALCASKLSCRPRIVYTEHGRLHPDRRRWKRFVCNPLLSLGVDHIVSISESTKKAMVQYDNFPEKRIKVIHNGVKLDFDNRDSDVEHRVLDVAPDSRIIGTAARLEKIKNLPLMLKAFKKVLKSVPQAWLFIAGTGPEESYLKDLVKQMGIAPRVVFLGLRHDLREIYRLFDVFVLSSFTEGISVTLLEAMSAGLPVVATAVGGNSEVVVDGETGRLVPLGDENAMAERIVEFLKDRTISNAFGRRGLQRVTDRFSFDRMLRRYIDLYRESV